MIWVGKAVGSTCSSLAALAFALGCGGESLVSSETPLPPPTESPGPPAGGPPAPPPDTATPPPPVNPPDTVTPPPPDTTAPPPPPDYVGIPFGSWHLPTELYGSVHTGVLKETYPTRFVSDIEAARRAGTRVVLNLVGSEARLRDERGRFSLELWKKRVNRYRGIDISPYIADGTVVGHYLMDEPQDRSNWAGVPVTLAEVDEMARYSKELWPGMATIIRGWARELKGYNYQYLDAAWAQYHERFGDIDQFVANNVRDAEEAGLNLVVGLNLLAGGGRSGWKGYYKDRSAMNDSQITSWGKALLAAPTVCAFISWRHNEAYFARPDVQAALEEVSQHARSLPKRSCARR
jgi:hypothetical protein